MSPRRFDPVTLWLIGVLCVGFVIVQLVVGGMP